MPCRGPELTRNESKRNEYVNYTQECLKYAASELGIRRKREILDLVNKKQGFVFSQEFSDEITVYLCDLLKGLNVIQQDRIIYNAHDRRSRDLANWWEEHQKLDRKRSKR